MSRNNLEAPGFTHSIWYEPEASLLAKAAKAYPPCELYADEDGKINIVNTDLHPKHGSLVTLGQRLCLAGLLGLLLLIAFYLLTADIKGVN